MSQMVTRMSWACPDRVSLIRRLPTGPCDTLHAKAQMNTPTLLVSRPDGKTDTYELTGQVTTLGRRTGCTVPLAGADVSRDHAEIVEEPRGLVLRDKGSRFGTFVNDEQVTEHVLRHRDRIRLGRSSDCEIVFSTGGTDSELRLMTGSGDFLQLAALLDSLRALGSSRVLDDVLAVVVDSAIEVSGAQRGFIMLAGADGVLDFKMGRARGRVTLPGRTFETSRKIPDEVFSTGKTRIVNFDDPGMADGHPDTVFFGILHVLCVPLVLVRYVERAEADSGEKRIGVLYLDSRARRRADVAEDARGARGAGGRGGRRHRERAALSRVVREGSARARAADRRRNPARPDAAGRARGCLLRGGRGVGPVPGDRRGLLRLPRPGRRRPWRRPRRRVR